jgi:transcriptional regulator with XRE-family HTH domain
MEISVKDRLRKYIKETGITQTFFCKEIGVSTGYISGMRESIQPDKLKSIALKFPQLNIGWLLTGVGSMLKDSVVEASAKNIGTVEVSAEAWNVIKKQADSLASKDRQVEELISILKKANVRADDNAVSAGVG